MPADIKNDVILLTCASGMQCSQLIPLLYGNWKHIRLAVNSASSEEFLKVKYPEADVVRGDMADAHDARRFLSGVIVVIYIGPSKSNESQIGFTMINAAQHEFKYGQLKHFIYSSVLHPHLQKLRNHRNKQHVEEFLIDSGLPYTIVQPSHILDSFPIALLLNAERSIFPVMFDIHTKFSFTILKDLAEALGKIILEREKHYFAQYMICSTGPTAYADIISILQDEIGRPIQIKPLDFLESGEFRKEAVSDTDSLPHSIRDAIQRLSLVYNIYGLKGNSNVLEWLLGRKPTTVREYIHRRILYSKKS
ncbi:SDR family oxidoreductase [Aspergillus saccharolyticus JOP 1030-1]|uniref:Putative nucleoside-diphosphate-sugar epimerase n=1 Tax=Aspergillus saccharolyticus JOP 1030-1 TaxID=1450539 RepID=A0A318Z6X9_9EURO|nr:putative nucleoside-diphosphate-sugar epimerase [Aspergillus saccharolyticus JOP 1030-1]PYH40473.1 putative nucleoside-diphosphate-sugar epimerase [Aspergillus saccharolyticus JOP 1030-1]